MNRQIKFRFYDKALSKMVYRSILPYDNEHPEIEVMQFTGREDADINGVEVYEGDIIENCDTKALQIVYWNENEAAWYCRYVEDEKRTVSLSDSLGNLNKVVGNIFENADLLQVAS
jgi:glutamine synthetase